MSKKFFSLIEVNRMLPFLKSTAREIVELSRDIRSLEDDRKGHKRSTGEDPQLRSKQVELKKCVGDLERLGCEIKNPGPLLKGEPPLLDFPAVVEGKEGYFCWQYGEESIEYWHDVESGFAGRKRLAVGS